MAREAQGRRFARPGTVRSCPGELVTGPDGSHLIVDCDGCSGSSDLSSRRCWAGVLPLVAELGVGEELLHQREIEVRYQDGTRELLEAAAQILRFLGSASTSQGDQGASSRRPSCTRCRAGWRETAEHWRSLLLTEPDAFCEELDNARRLLANRRCPQEARCGGNLAGELLSLGAVRDLSALLDKGHPVI